MITVDYPNKHKVIKFAREVGLYDIIEENSIPYFPSGTSFVVCSIPNAVSGTSFSVVINGKTFTEYAVRIIDLNQYCVVFPINNIDVWKLGENTIEIFQNTNRIAYQVVLAKNILELLYCTIGYNDNLFSMLREAFSATSLQTMDESHAIAKLSAIYSKPPFLTNTQYSHLIKNAFTGILNGNIRYGLQNVFNGIVNSTPKILTLTRNANAWYDKIEDTSSIFLRRIDITKDIKLFQKLTIINTRQMNGTQDPIVYQSTPIHYSHIDNTFPFLVYSNTTSYHQNIDFVLKPDTLGNIFIEWLAHGSNPTPNTQYTIELFYVYCKNQDYQLIENNLGEAFVDWSIGDNKPQNNTQYTISFSYCGYDIFINNNQALNFDWVLKNKRLHEPREKNSMLEFYQKIQETPYPVYEEKNQRHFLIKPNTTRTDTLVRNPSETYDIIRQEGKTIPQTITLSNISIKYGLTVFQSAIDYTITSINGVWVVQWISGGNKPPNNAKYTITYSLPYETILNSRTQWIYLQNMYAHDYGIRIVFFNYGIFAKEVAYLAQIPESITLSNKYFIGKYTLNGKTYPRIFYIENGEERIITNYTMNMRTGFITILDPSASNKTIHVEYYFIPIHMIRTLEQKVCSSVPIHHVFLDKNGKALPIGGI